MMVVSVVSGSSNQNRLAQEFTNELEVVFPDCDLRRTIAEANESVVGL